MTLDDCTVNRSNQVEGGFTHRDGEGGTFTLAMQHNGKFSTLNLLWSNGTVQILETTQKRSVASAAAPPPHSAWVFESLLGRCEAKLITGDSVGALDDARLARKLFCLQPSVWKLVERCSTSENADELREARAELRWLAGGLAAVS